MAAYSYADIQLYYYTYFESSQPPFMKGFINDEEGQRIATALETNLKPTALSNLEDIIDTTLRDRILHLLARNQAFAAVETFADAHKILNIYNKAYQQKFGITIDATFNEQQQMVDSLEYFAFHQYVTSKTREQIQNEELFATMQETALLFKDDPTLFAYQIHSWIMSNANSTSEVNNNNPGSVQKCSFFYSYSLPHNHPSVSTQNEPRVYFGHGAV